MIMAGGMLPGATAKSRLIEHISKQFAEIQLRVDSDVARHAHASPCEAALGFVLYFLKDISGEPLKDVQLAPAGITTEDMEATAGYKALMAHCERLFLKVRLDAHFYSDKPQLTRIYQVIVDGWN